MSTRKRPASQIARGLTLAGLTLSAVPAVAELPGAGTKTKGSEKACGGDAAVKIAPGPAELQTQIASLEKALTAARTAKNAPQIAQLEKQLTEVRASLAALAPKTGIKGGAEKSCGADGKSCGGAK